MRRVYVVIGSVLASLSATVVFAQTASFPGSGSPGGAASSPSSPIIDPRFEGLRAVLESHGPDSPYFGPDGLSSEVRVDGVSAYLRFRRTLSASEIGAMEESGVELVRRADRRVVVGRVYGAFVRWDALDALRSHPLLEVAEVAWHPRLEVPLEVTGREIGAARSRAIARPGADGRGAVIGDIDSGIDVLHPHFFFADGGAFEWIDTDGDGVFEPGIDAIDYDRDGEADGRETARVLDGASATRDGSTANDDGVLDVHLDWVYADANRDGERNVGYEAGFTEFDPGYGEPLFVVDDVNGNGLLDPDERLFLLSTSKVRRLVTTERTYVRGEDLIRSTDSSTLEQSFHGTGVASILVGGQPIAHDRVGIAPGAEIVMYSSHRDGRREGFDDTAQLADLQDAVDNRLDVVVHEWTNPYTAPLDGSGNFEAAMSAAREAGVVQVNPLGNLNLSEKHFQVDVAAGSDAEFVFIVDPDGFAWGNQRFPYSAVYGSLHWRADQSPRVSLVNPDGVEVELPRDGSVVGVGEDYVHTTEALTERGTHHVVFTVWNDDQNTSIVAGDWALKVTETTADDRFVGRIGDFYSSWSIGVRWREPTRDVGTAVYPATADAAIGVAAYAGRHDQPREGSSVGQLRNFSGRGPRIDGAQVVDIAAPDDPYAAFASTEAYRDAGFGRSWFSTFGGTSGAGPHVAGTVALLRGLEPAMTPDEIEMRLGMTARTDGHTPDATALPDSAWGAGKLDVFSAVHGMPAREQNDPPVARIDVSMVGGGEVELSAASSTDPDGDALSYRWDFEYDGAWDTEFSDSPTATAVYEVGSEVVVRLDARDGQGGIGGAVHRFLVEEATDGGDAGPGVDAGPSIDVNVVDDGDVERPPDESEPPPCGCASAADGGFWSVVVFVLVAARRRL